MKYKWLPKDIIEEELQEMWDYERYKMYKQEPLSNEWYEEEKKLLYLLKNNPKWRWWVNEIIYLPIRIKIVLINLWCDINNHILPQRKTNDDDDLPF